MKTIHKYPIETTITLPKGAKIVSVGSQYANDKNRFYIWAEIDTEADLEDRHFVIYGTGWGHDKFFKEYIGTIHSEGFVWHVYEYLKEIKNGVKV